MKVLQHLLTTSLQSSEAEAVNISVPHLLLLSAAGPAPPFSFLHPTRPQSLVLPYTHGSCGLLQQSHSSYLVFL